MTQAVPEPLIDRRRYIGLKTPIGTLLDVACGEARSIAVSAGSIVSITSIDGGSPCLLTGMDDRSRNFSPAQIEAPGAITIPLGEQRFDRREMVAIAISRDAVLADATAIKTFDASTEPGDVFIFRARAAFSLYVIAPVDPNLLEAGGGGSFRVQIKAPSGSENDILLPKPLGSVCDEWRIETGTAKAYQVKKGQFIQVIDVEGQQCSDFMAMRADALDDGLERYIDSTVSRTMARATYPTPGLHDKFFDQDIKPLLAVVQDTVGRHDTFALACTARGYEERGFPGHLNCSDNISAVFSPFGIAARRAWPAINFFFNSWIDDTNAIASDEAWSRPGDYVVMQALTDLVCVSTACPDDVDPINGWNPTDVHVRIYEENANITRSVSWRANAEDAGKSTENSSLHSRTSKLTSNFAVSRNLWLATNYDSTGTIEEYWACRERATLQDMSSLLKFDIVGPDAEHLLQICLTRDVSKLAQHRGIYALICDSRGNVLDDGTLFRLEPTAFRWCCGSEDSALHLREQAEMRGLSVRILEIGPRMANLAIQGPKSRDILREVVFTQPNRPSLENLKWFGFTIARLGDREGPMFMLSRTGFTGELGYELFFDREDAEEIWDRLVTAGRRRGLVPMGSDALAILRIEAGLMTAGAEFGPEADAMESGLGFAVDFKKPEFIGKEALQRNAASPRRKLVGLTFSGNEAPAHGDKVFIGREQVGVVTSACVSPGLEHAIAMARVAIENAAVGTELEVGRLDGKMKRLPCKVTSLPFVDPKREKPRA